MKNILYKLIIIAFVAALSLPLIVMELNIMPVVNNEKRTLAQRPDSFDAYAYESYLVDNFGFKNTLVYLDGAYKKMMYSTSSRQALLGNDGWIFLTCPDQPEYDPVTTFVGQNLFTDEQLELLSGKLQDFKNRLQENGIEFHLVIPPNKATVYSEMLPWSIQKYASKTRMQQLSEYLADKSDVNVIDVCTALKADHTVHQNYYKTDTHWNSYGAFVAYREIMSKLNLAPHDIDDYTITQSNPDAMDMALLLGRPDITETGYDFTLNTSEPQPELIEGVFDSEKLSVFTNHHDSDPAMMIYHDSYTYYLMPFLTPHFSKTISRWKLAPQIDEILERKPDIVVFEILERNLEYLCTWNP